MGKQIWFFMLTQDECNFVQFICSNPNVVPLLPTCDQPEVKKINECNFINRYPQSRVILLWNTDFDFSLDFFRPLQRTKLTEGEKVIGQEETFYRIDTSNAPIIEFIRPFINNEGKLVKGRIWAEMRRVEGGVFVHKGEAFEAWYDQLAQWIRRHFTRIPELDAYAGPEALEWLNKGGVPLIY